MGCDCGEREISDEQEKDCEDSKLLDNEDVDYYHGFVSEISIQMLSQPNNNHNPKNKTT